MNNRDALISELTPILKTYRSADLEAKLIEAGIPCSKVMPIGEAIEDPHVKARQIVADSTHIHDDTPVKLVKTPIFLGSLQNCPPDVRLLAPRLGQHSADLLRELGYGDGQIGDLINSGAVVQAGGHVGMNIADRELAVTS